MHLLQGSYFDQAEPARVEEFLHTRKLRTYTLEPEMLSAVNDGERLLVRFSDGSWYEYACRETFLEKIFRWHSVPIRLTGILGIDSITDIVNDLFLAIKSPLVTLTVENDEVLSIVSSRYSAISDLEVIALCREQGIGWISRSDRLMRLCSEVRREAAPIPGDMCGFGFNVVNSETGFGALSSHQYLIRYICSNGAIVRVPGEKLRSGVHYAQAHGALQRMLGQALMRLDELLPQLETGLKESARMAAGNAFIRVRNDLKGLLGAREARAALGEIDEHSSLYALFNQMTAHAKSLRLEKRLTVESLAGDLLRGVQG